MFTEYRYDEKSEIDQIDFLKLFINNYNIVIVDIRSPANYKEGHIPTAINIPYFSLQKDMSCLSLFPNETIILYCNTGVRVVQIEILLRQENITNYKNLLGGFIEWKSSGQIVSSL